MLIIHSGVTHGCSTMLVSVTLGLVAEDMTRCRRDLVDSALLSICSGNIKKLTVFLEQNTF